MRAMKMLLQKQIKGSEVKLGNRLNEFMHQNGRKNPPQKVEVKMYKFKDTVIADVLDAPFMKEEEKKKGLAEKVKGLVGGKKADVPEVEKEDMLQKTPVKQEQDMKPKQELKTTKEELEKVRKQDIIVKPQRPVHEKKK